MTEFRVKGPTCEAVVCDDPDDWEARALATGRYYEQGLLEAICAKNLVGVYLDIGAHVGNHSAFFALECPAVRVVALEPNPPSFALLRQTIAANGLVGRADWLNMACHPSWQAVDVIPGPPGNTGMATVIEGSQIPAIRLDALADGLQVAVVKIDVEGLGAAVLASGRKLLQRDRPLLAVEARDQGEQRMIAAVLKPFGYRPGPTYCATPVTLWEAR